MSLLTQEEFDRFDKVLLAVLEEPDRFTDFENDFAMTNADRLELYGRSTAFSEEQRRVIDEIERKIEGGDDARRHTGDR